MKITLLPYDSCKKIASLLHYSIADPPYRLHKDVFGKTHEVKSVHDFGYYKIIGDWWVPPCFVSYVSR